MTDREAQALAADAVAAAQGLALGRSLDAVIVCIVRGPGIGDVVVVNSNIAAGDRQGLLGTLRDGAAAVSGVGAP